jgi:CheY-like chemotaxis protein/signal transduction histidine kinase
MNRILIIEDNPDNMELARYLLEAHGYECVPATDGESGVQRARECKPDLVICDLQLPGMDGFQVLRELRGDASLHNMPVVAVTAYAMVGDRERVLAAGFDGYISKPLDPERFVGQVAGFLQASQPPPPTVAHVLVVDDRPVNAELLATVLTYYGYTVEHARDGIEALERIAARRPDLVITDLLMPNLDGEALCLAVRANPSLAGLPLVIHTASYRSRQARQVADRVGVRWVLAKPSEPSEIISVVREALGYDATGKVVAELPQSSDASGATDLSGLQERNVRLTGLLADAMSIAEVQQQTIARHITRDAGAVGARLDSMVNLALQMSWERDPRVLLETFAFALQDLLSARYVGVVAMPAGGGAPETVLRGLDAATREAVAGAVAGCGAARALMGMEGTHSRMIVAASRGDFTGLPDAHPAVHNLLACVIMSRDREAGWLYAADRLGDEGFGSDDERLLVALAALAGTFWGGLAAMAELDQRVAERTQELEAANAELETFSYAVSHDLRAPLGAIDGFSKALREKFGDALPPGALRYLDRIQVNAEVMGHLIEDLLDFARLSRASLHWRRVDLGQLVQDCLGEVQEELDTRGITVMRGPLPSLDADPILLRQVFANLVGNAVKYTRKQPHPVIEVGARVVGGEHLIFVRDNGAGFDMEAAASLFSPFKRLHNAAEFEGNGIGLAIVRQIVTRHGGRVWVDAKVGEGACFTFTLPAAVRGIA